ncbi:uncharacterized protein EDB91DRAFT_1347976 [Suillus paluster]|uniref:uncharacterized protein n=1 Tax=Suillus paluster TaxID=48578 RepID=UPI001B8692CA|nr:uncharacterized protein EDB91DRAFT_1347976 [Suillus paluster]KAG1736904.1 hypothetical protein EDB91DRAFT_1347976 [Suillus paluster]
MAPRKSSKVHAAQLRETRKARMQTQLANLAEANAASDKRELNEPSAGQSTRAAKTAALTRPNWPIKQTRVRGLKEPSNSSSIAVSQAVMSVLDLATNSAAKNTKLLEDVNYIYPWSAEKDKYDTSKPFQAEVIKEGVRAGFFITNQYNDIGLKFSYLLTSSLSTAPDELEVVDHMIAGVATAVEANILDFNVSKSSEFVGPSHDNTFKAHMLLLLTMKQKKPLEYHKLAHGIYRAVIGIRNVGPARLSKEQIIARVDWVNMGSESD